jgi:hypothetical protein
VNRSISASRAAIRPCGREHPIQHAGTRPLAAVGDPWPSVPYHDAPVIPPVGQPVLTEEERHFPLSPPWRLLVVDVLLNGSVLKQDEIDEGPELVQALMAKRGLTAQLHPEDLPVPIRRSRVDEVCSRLGLASNGTDPCAERDVVVPVAFPKRSQDDVDPGFPDTAMVVTGCEIDRVWRLCPMYEAPDQRVHAPAFLTGSPPDIAVRIKSQFAIPPRSGRLPSASQHSSSMAEGPVHLGHHERGEENSAGPQGPACAVRAPEQEHEDAGLTRGCAVGVTGTIRHVLLTPESAVSRWVPYEPTTAMTDTSRAKQPRSAIVTSPALVSGFRSLVPK